jgi:hypothetical protein
MPPDKPPTVSPPETHQEGAVNLNASEILKLSQVLGYDFMISILLNLFLTTFTAT